MTFRLLFRFLARGKTRFACAAAGVAAAAGIAAFAFCLSATNDAQAPRLAARASAPWTAWRFDMPGEGGRGARPRPGTPEPDLKLTLVSCNVDYRPGGIPMQGPPMRAVAAAAPAACPWDGAPLASGRWPDADSPVPEIACSAAMFARFKRHGLPPIGSELKFVGRNGTATARITGYLADAKLPPGFPGVFANAAAFAGFEKEAKGALSLWKTAPADSPEDLLRPDSESVAEGFKSDDMRTSGYAKPLMLAAAILTALCLLANSLLLSVEANRRELALLRVAGMTRGGIARLVAAEAFLAGIAGCIAGCAAACGALLAWTRLAPGTFPAGAEMPGGTLGAIFACAVAVSALAAVFACRAAMGVRPLESAGDRPARRRRGMAVAFACGYAAFVAVETWGASLMRAFVPSPKLPDAIVSLLPCGAESYDIEKIQAVPGVKRATELYPLQLPFDPLEEMKTPAGRTARGGGRGGPGGRGGRGWSYRNILVLGSEWLPDFKMLEGTHAECAAALSNSYSCVISEMTSRARNLHKGDELALRTIERGKPGEKVVLKIAGVADVNWHMATSRGLVRGLNGAPVSTDGPAFVSLKTAEWLDSRQPFTVKMTHAWVEYDDAFQEKKGVFQAGREIEAGIAAALDGGDAFTVRLHARDEIADGTLAHGSDIIGQVARIPVFFLAILSIGFIAMVVADADASRRELNVLRAVGATRFQIVRRLAAGAAGVALKGMCFGLPTGAAAGWFFARRTGAIWPGLPPYFEIPWLAVAEGSLAAVAFALAAAVPAAFKMVKTR